MYAAYLLRVRPFQPGADRSLKRFPQPAASQRARVLSAVRQPVRRDGSRRLTATLTLPHIKTPTPVAAKNTEIIYLLQEEGL